ncbi:MAG: hypothetical protein MR314_06415 [Ezakiella sp.]|nr:hypothetical protein [Ezakiella sp.]
MKRTIIFLLMLSIFFSGCSTVESVVRQFTTEDHDIVYNVIDNMHLIIRKDGGKYVVTDEIVTGDETVFRRGEGSTFIVRNDDGIINAGKLFELQGTATYISGLDIKKRLIEIGGIVYKVAPYRGDNKKTLNLNHVLHEDDMDFRLSENDYSKFVDKDGNLYKLGDIVDEDKKTLFLSQVKLRDEIIVFLTYDKDTMKVVSTKERFKLKNEEEADKLVTVQYGNIYKMQDGNYAVEVDGELVQLVKEDN